MEMREVAHELTIAVRILNRLLRSLLAAENPDDKYTMPTLQSHGDAETVFAFDNWISLGTVRLGDHPDHGTVVLKAFRNIPRRRANGHPVRPLLGTSRRVNSLYASVLIL